MKQATHEISVKTRGRGLVNINDEIISWVHAQGMTTGLLTVFIRHTSASLVVQENADPDVLRDLSAFLDRLVPDGDPQYRHSSEGDDDMPAHIRSALTQTQISVPLVKGRLTLGTWQDIYLFEHRTAPHRRQVVLHLSGE
ncbi:MAG: secondary thiamine-phosphate synthase enzyme YjbQ [Nitrospinaceae bacterium]|jgi:secondary thiamine-phosphate synthase enzyme